MAKPQTRKPQASEERDDGLREKMVSINRVTKVVKGAVKGSTSVTVEDASRFREGDLLLVDQRNDPDLVELRGTTIRQVAGECAPVK